MTKRKAILFASTFLAMSLFSVIAFAQDGGAADNKFTVAAAIALAEGFGLGIAALGGALAQGRATAAALEGIARNPSASGRLFTPMILGLALIESLVIYSLVIAFILNGSLGSLVATMIV